MIPCNLTKIRTQLDSAAQIQGTPPGLVFGHLRINPNENMSGPMNSDLLGAQARASIL
jgi:hypothetical protein